MIGRAQSIAWLLCMALLAGPVAAQGTAVSIATPAVDPDEPVEVTADSLRINRESGNAIFEGNVRVVQGELLLAAQEIEVFYTEDDDAAEPVERLLASGDVLLVNGEDSAEAQRAEFLPAQDRLIMEGSVLLTQGRVVLSGERMVLNLESGEGVVEGRVRTVLNPASE